MNNIISTLLHPTILDHYYFMVKNIGGNNLLDQKQTWWTRLNWTANGPVAACICKVEYMYTYVNCSTMFQSLTITCTLVSMVSTGVHSHCLALGKLEDYVPQLKHYNRNLLVHQIYIFHIFKIWCMFTNWEHFSAVLTPKL